MSKMYVKIDRNYYYIKYSFVFKTRCNRRVFANNVAKSLFTEECREIELELGLNIHNIIFGENFVCFSVDSNIKYSPNDIAQKIKSRTSKVIRSEIQEFKKMPSLWIRELFVSTEEHINQLLIKDFLNLNKK